jgi:hypothetical protein
MRNRVTPLGDVVAVAERGAVYGNRGCLHDAAGRIVRRSATRRWIACRLAFRGWYQGAAPRPGRFTGLFFLDDATAFAAGHRPCALCRRADYNQVLAVTGARGADELDTRLHAERTGPRPLVEVQELPRGAFVLVGGEPHVALDGAVHRWTPGGYERARPAPPRAELVTPSTLVPVLAAGWDPLVEFLGPVASEDGPPGPGGRS